MLVLLAMLGLLAAAVRADASDEPVDGSLLDRLPVGAAVSGIVMAPGSLVGGATELVLSDGDHVVYEARSGGAGGTWDRPVRHDGFSTYGDATVLDRFDIRLVSSPGIEDLRPHFERAAAAATSAGAPPLRVVPGTVPNGTPVKRGEVHVVVSSTSPCSGWWLGCGGPVVDEGLVIAARIWINPRLLEREASQIDNTSRHEVGHAMGLGHYEHLHDGHVQTMHPSSFEASTYQSGDRAGFRFVTGNDGADPPPVESIAVAGSATARTPPAPQPPPPVDPTGHVEVAGSTPFGLSVAGWADDPDSSEPVVVLLTVDGAPVETRADRPRPDGSANAFTFALPVGPGTHEVCVLLRNAGPGADVRLGCRAVEVSDRSISRVGLQTV